ncbi:MAG: hypothetical protein AAFV33_06720 [Chloroflexota bacterium]
MASDCTFEWLDNNHTTLLVNVNSSLTWKAYHTGMQSIQQLVAASSHTVHVVYDVDETIANVLPPGGGVQAFNRTVAEQPANLGLQILVHPPKLLQMTLQLYLMSIGVYANQAVQFVDSVDEATMVIGREGRHGQQASAG